MSLHVKFSEILRQYREEHHLTQLKMAEICGVSDRFYQSLEKGKSLPSLPLALYLAKILNFSLDELILEAQDDYPDPS
ncbi:MAG TPA: helix-turn-helix domain-containing protein [Candidatus Gallacutalibacter stercoravium]|nr:helix-turn-helix domain-containing protein [Candidatus Gallacutalibacter stercoravium]